MTTQERRKVLEWLAQLERDELRMFAKRGAIVSMTSWIPQSVRPHPAERHHAALVAAVGSQTRKRTP